MIAHRYTRTRDGVSVDASEACNPNGTLRDGYSVPFSLAFMDAAPAASLSITDAERAFADSEAGKAIVDKARRSFEARQAHRPLSERQVWTDAMEAAIVSAHAPKPVADHGPILGAGKARAEYITAQALRREALAAASRR